MTKVMCCFKIKSATLIIGFVDLMVHLLIIVSFLAAMQKPMGSNIHPYDVEPHFSIVKTQLEKSFGDLGTGASVGSSSNRNFRLDLQQFEDPENKMPNDIWFYTIYSNRTKQNKPVGLLVAICSTFITMLLIYGILKNRPSYIMPYFSIKVFQVVIACLSTLGFYSCLPNLKTWIEQQRDLPMRDELLSMKNHQLELLTFTVLLIIILIKLYMVVIVWYCYRYMVTMETFHNLHLLSTTSTGVSAHFNPMAGFTSEDNVSTNIYMKVDNDAFLINAPPKYDDVIKQQQQEDKDQQLRSSRSDKKDELESFETASSSSNHLSLPPEYQLVISSENEKAC